MTGSDQTQTIPNPGAQSLPAYYRMPERCHCRRSSIPTGQDKLHDGRFGRSLQAYPFKPSIVSREIYGVEGRLSHSPNARYT